MTSRRDLFQKLGRELLQTETSAVVQGHREASRLPGTPAAEALVRISRHAEASLAELPPSFQYGGSLGLSPLLGQLFSGIRQLVVDRMTDRERSYRATLRGMRHGIDVVRLLAPLARAQREAAFESWCIEWLYTREELVEQATAQLEWFAMHPRQAIQTSTRPLAMSHD